MHTAMRRQPTRGRLALSYFILAVSLVLIGTAIKAYVFVPSDAPGLGDEGYIYSGKNPNDSITAFTNLNSLEAARKASAIKDTYGFYAALVMGSVSLAPNTRIQVIDIQSRDVLQVRALTGRHTGTAGFVPKNTVHKQPH